MKKFFWLFGSILVSCSNDGAKNDDIVCESTYAAIAVGYPSETMNLDNRTDSFNFGSCSLTSIDFFNLGNYPNSRVTFSPDQISESKRLNKNISVHRLSKTSLAYLCFEHENLGVIYVRRTDWQLEKSYLISQTGFDNDYIANQVKICERYFEEEYVTGHRKN